jgi:hypothetical protein
MSEDGEGRGGMQILYNVNRLLDCHTHLTGQESAEEILECMDACGVEKAFLFAPGQREPLQLLAFHSAGPVVADYQGERREDDSGEEH